MDIKIIPFFIDKNAYFQVHSCSIELKTPEQVVETFKVFKDVGLYSGDIPTVAELESIYTEN